MHVLHIPVIHEDEAMIVIDKPAGITVNRAETTRHEMTIQDWVEEKYNFLSFKYNSGVDSDFYKRAGIVHRIDKETSGILLIAKNPAAFVDLQLQFKNRQVKKMYIALVHGEVIPAAGEINVPVGRLPWNRNRFGILPGGRESMTRYTTLSHHRLSISDYKTEEMSLLALYPQSGRTHQLRVHLKYIGHPIFSDFLYAGRKTARADRKLLPRVFLHATKITFQHPATGAPVSFDSPLPEPLRAVITHNAK